MIPIREHIYVSTGVSRSFQNKNFVRCTFLRKSEELFYLSGSGAACIAGLPAPRDTQSLFRWACIPPGMGLSSKNRLGEPSWLRKGLRALTPRIAQKNAILHLTRIVPTKGSWPAWKQVCACPQPYWFCGLFCVLERPHARSPKQAL